MRSPDPFRRRRLRGRLVRLRTPLAVLAGSGVLVGLGWVVAFSSVLGVDQVQVSGLRDVVERRVTDAAMVSEDTPLARLDLEAIEAGVEQIPAVADATVDREWPDAVTIEVTERVAVAVVSEQGRLHAMDGEGVLFEVLERASADLPRITARKIPPDQRADALREVAAVVTSLDPGIASRVHHVELSSMDSIELALRNGKIVRWGSAEDSDRKAEVLQALMTIEADVYDVSVPEMPTTS